MRIFIVIILLLSALGSVNAKEVVVEIFKKQFIPAEITIEAGDTVIWKNVEKRQYHNVWFKQLVKEEPDYIFPGDNVYQQYCLIAFGYFSNSCGCVAFIFNRALLTMLISIVCFLKAIYVGS